MGFAGGWLFYRLWRALLPRDRSRQFWTILPVSVRGMLGSEDPSDLMRHYRVLIGETARFSARSTVAVLVALAPVSALYFLFDALEGAQALTMATELSYFVAVMSGSGAAAWWARQHKKLAR